MYLIVSRVLVVVFCLLSMISIHAQCPKGVVHLKSDEEIKEFARTYPNCSSLDSSLIVGPDENMKNTRITDISPLSKIKIVNGDLLVTGNPWLKSIRSIENIEVVEGECKLLFSNELKDSKFSSKLIKIGGSFTLMESQYQNKVEVTFPDLILIGGELNLYVEEVGEAKFPSLWKIGGSIWKLGYRYNYAEGAFPSLEIVKGNLRINYKDKEEYNNPVFRNLKEVGYLTISGKRSKRVYFGNLSKVKNLTIEGGFTAEIPSVQLIDSLESLTIEFASKELIQSFKSLKYVKKLTLNRSESGGHNLSLKSLKGVQNVKIGDQHLIPFINSIDSIPGEVVIWNLKDDGLLNDFLDKRNLKRLHLGQVLADTIRISKGENIDLFEVSNSKQLVYLENNKLGGPSFSSITIKSNPKLKDIGNFNFLPGSKSYKYINIERNESLDNCAVPFVCALLKTKAYNVSIHKNGPDCTKELVMEKCKE